MSARSGSSSEPVAAVRPAPRRILGYRSARLVSWGLFGAAAALAMVFAVHIARFEAATPARPADEAAAPVSNQVVVTRSTITGFDDDLLPYELSAESAVQDAGSPNHVHLKTVSAALHQRSGDVLSLAARTALFDSKTDVLQLEGDVTLVTAGRFVAEMDKAQVTLADKRLHAQTPVSVRFDGGHISAGGLEITEDGNRIVFFNRAKLTFGPQAKGNMVQ